MQELTQQIINGIAWGAIYALIAVGYTMVYGVLRFINFAHGDVFMVGSVAGFYAATWWASIASRYFPNPSSNPFLLVLVTFLILGSVMLFAMLTCGILGFLIERLAYRPLRNRPRLTVLITAIGVSMLLEYGLQNPHAFGPTPQAFPQILPRITLPISIGGVITTPIDIIIVAVTLILMVSLSLIVKFTRTGMALRAVSHNFDTAALMGINVNRIISLTFVLGSVLAAAAGVLWVNKYPKVEPLMGLMPGIKAFVAAVLGGIGNIYGAVVGGILLGLVEVLVVGYLPGGSQYRDGVAFVILIAVLLIKPSGIFGRNVSEKV